MLPPVLRPRPLSPRLTFWQAIPWALGQLGPTALPELCVAFSDSNLAVRQAVHGAIGNITEPVRAETVRALMQLLADPRGDVRGEAAFALGQLATPNYRHEGQECIPELRRMTSDVHPYARQEAAFALWRISRDTNIVTVLITELAQASDLETGTRIVDYFCQIGGPARAAMPAISNVVWSSPKLRSLTNVIRLIGPKGLD
jgi:HEAT repeat protein